MSTRERITRVLEASRDGSREAAESLYHLVYPELRRLARSALRRGRPDAPVLDTTALVHEAYLKLVDQTRAIAGDRGQFLGIAARAMRQIIVDHARERRALKRGGGNLETHLNDWDGAIDTHADRVLAINEALDRLGQDDPRLLKIVECRFFAGYTDAETAESLGVSTRTVERDWLRAKARLREVLQSGGSDGAGH